MEKISAFVTFPDLLIWLPIMAGLVSFMLRKDNQVKAWSLFISILTLFISVSSLFITKYPLLNTAPWSWMPGMGAGYTIGLDGMGRVLTFLTALAFPLILTENCTVNVVLAAKELKPKAMASTCFKSVGTAVV